MGLFFGRSAWADATRATNAKHAARAKRERAREDSDFRRRQKAHKAKQAAAKRRAAANKGHSGTFWG